jgi:hypothetical protein
MTTTQLMRTKYAKRQYGANVFDRYPPGGADIHTLCDIIDRLEVIVRHAQHRLPLEQQNEVERMMWGVGL